MNLTYALTSVLFGLMLVGCDSHPSGLLQQQIAELEAQCAAARSRADQLQARLDAKEAQPVAVSTAPKTESPQQSDDSKALVAAAALNKQDLLREKMKQMNAGMLQVYGEAAWAGFSLEQAGENRGVAVPFFRTENGDWVCGWSDTQIIEALGGRTPVGATPIPPPAVSPPVVVDVPPQPVISPPAETMIVQPSVPPPPPQTRPAVPPSGASKTFFVDPATGKTYRIKPDGTRELVPEFR